MTPAERIEAARKNGVCPAQITLQGLANTPPVRISCERGYDHAGDHLTAGLEYRFARGSSVPTITRRLTTNLPRRNQ